MNLDDALKLVRAAGYRVSKPKPRKLARRGPTCVVQFADGQTCRMTTHCDDQKLDWERGYALCAAAWQSRRRQEASDWSWETFFDPPPAPQVASIHFERDGNIISEQKEAA